MAKYYSKNFGVSLKQIRVVPNSINLNRFQPKDYDRAKFRKKLTMDAEFKRS